MGLPEALAELLTSATSRAEVTSSVAGIARRFDLTDTEARILAALPKRALAESAKEIMAKRWERMSALMPATALLLSSLDSAGNRGSRARLIDATIRRSVSAGTLDWRLQEASNVTAWLLGQASAGLLPCALAELARHETQRIELTGAAVPIEEWTAEEKKSACRSHARMPASGGRCPETSVPGVRLLRSPNARCAEYSYDVLQLLTRPDHDLCGRLPAGVYRVLAVAVMPGAQIMSFHVGELVAAAFARCGTPQREEALTTVLVKEFALPAEKISSALTTLADIGAIRCLQFRRGT